MRNNPYVVSADIKLLLAKWAWQNRFILPSDEFFRSLRKEFVEFMSEVFRRFEFIPEEVLSDGIRSLVSEIGLPAVSLDRAYCTTLLSLDLNRVVDAREVNQGRKARPGCDPLIKQLRRIRDAGYREVAIVDDVVFTGGTLTVLCRAMQDFGIRVPLICAGVVIRDGEERLTKLGYEVRGVKRFDSIIDQICERDFYPGVPYSGRTSLVDNVGLPYLLPFGNPVKWASIPESWAVEVSRFCITMTSRLFEEIGRRTGRTVLCSDLERKVISLPQGDIPFDLELRKAFEQL